MSFKYVDSLNNEPNLIEFESVSDLFNPLKNKAYKKMQTSFKWKHLLLMAKAIFSRENLLNKAFVKDALGWNLTRDEQYTAWKKILEVIPDEHLYLFCFADMSIGNRSGFCIYYPLGVVAVHENISFQCRDISWTIDFTHSSITAKLVSTTEQFARAHTLWQNIFGNDAYLGSRLLIHDHFYSAHHFVRMLVQASGALRVYQDTSDNTYTMEQARILMEANSNWEVRFTRGSYCVSLRRPTNDDFREPCYNMLPYSTPVHELISTKSIVQPGEKDPVLYGVELEVSTDYNVRHLVTTAERLFFACKQDGSIHGNKANQYEIVTIPMSYKAHKVQWARLFAKLDYSQFDTSKKTGNGMHVHIGRSHFHDDNHIRRLTWFISNPANKDFLFEISERDAASWQNYSPTFDVRTRKKATLIKNAVTLAANIRGAINLGSGKPTIEIRIFKGIVSYAGIVKNLEFVDSIFWFTADTNNLKLTANDYMAWLNATPPNKYSVLKRFFKEMKKLDDILLGCIAHDTIIGVSDDAQIATVLNKKGFNNNKTVTWLNKRKKIRQFIIDKTTGMIVVEHRNDGKVSHLDRDIEKRYTRQPSAA